MLGFKFSFLTASGGKYWLPSTMTVALLSAMTFPPHDALAISCPSGTEGLLSGSKPRKQSFWAGGARNGQSIVGRKSHRGKQCHRHCRGQPVFPARGRQKGKLRTQQSHFGLSVEGHRPLLPSRSGRHSQRQRRLVLR